MAADHADRVDPGWQDRAYGWVWTWALVQSDPWLLEDARQAAEVGGLERPPDRRAWGAVILRLKREGRIAAAGYRSAVSSRGGPKTLWKRTYE